MEEKDIDQLEKEFEQTFNQVNPQIQEKMKQAAKLIEEACAISDLHGIPFRPKVGTPFKMSYIPRSLKEKWKDILESDYGSDFVCDLTGAYGDYGGWQQSQVC